MKIAIAVLPDNSIPAVLAEKTDTSLVDALNALSATPGLSGPGAARVWLAGLPEPSGWYENIEEARAHMQARAEPVPMTGDELRTIRESLKLTRSDFGQRIGFAGKPSNINKQVWEMELGKKPVRSDKAAAVRRLVAAGMVESANTFGPTVLHEVMPE